MGLIEQGSRATGTGEADHEQGSAEGKSGEQIPRAPEHLAIADWACGAAVLAPGSRACDLGPAELISGGGNGLIRATGCAMEERLHQAASGRAQEMGGNELRRPSEITTATSHDHQLATTREKQRAKKGTIRWRQYGGLSERKHGKKMSTRGFLSRAPTTAEAIP
jgi:hypothetical protein